MTSMRARLESIIDSPETDRDRRATAMNALSHLASYEAQAAKASDPGWPERRAAIEARFAALVAELGLSP